MSTASHTLPLALPLALLLALLLQTLPRVLYLRYSCSKLHFYVRD